ncbi:hypothetical protein P3W45_001488 [Vairimorpha bombi]
MYIKDIILDGFKCYEHKTVIKNLDKSYNAITGLNGSGKSNIIDGIIFVLGLESRKLLRTNTIKELINVHRNDCKVTLILSNTDKNKSPEGYKDYNEIVLARSIDSTGKSKYFLNNHSCSLNTINKFCSSMNINSEKGEFFFIIMQGHITKVLNMKSREIGNLIEETAAYIEQKNIEQTKKDLIDEHKHVQNILLVDDISKNILTLKSIVENYMVDKKHLINLEQKLADLQEIEFEDNLANIKEILEDERMKLEDLKKYEYPDKIKRLKNEYESIKVVEKKYNLQELKERENLLIRNLKNTDKSFGGKDIGMIEELATLKLKKSELEYKLKNFSELNLEEISNKINNLERYKVDQDELQNDKNRLNYLRMKLSYPIKDNIFGTVDENIEIIDEKYKEAVFTIMGSKSKHVIVSDENIGSDLLNSSERRISVIPLTRIKSKFVDREVIKKIKSNGGLHMIDLISYNNKLKKAMEHVFNGYFVFENKEDAKRMCFDMKVMCVTLDGNIYDPKGTLTGGKSTYKNEIISSSEILSLQMKIDKNEQNANFFNKYRDEYESLFAKQTKCKEKDKLSEELQITEVKINTISKYENSTSNLHEEISEVRNLILEAIKEENLYKENVNKKDKLMKEIEDLEIRNKENDIQQETTINKILKLQDKLGELEIKSSNKRLSERQIEGLEPKQKYLIRSTSKLKNRINKIYNEICEDLKKLEDADSYNTPGNETWVQKYREEEYREIFDEFGISESIFNFKIQEIDEKQNKEYLNRLDELKASIDRCNQKKTVRMDPSNFDLLEKNEMIIQSLKEKIKQLEEDKQNILSSINNFDLLGVKENEKAFKHLNNKVGNFLRYFLKDSDVKIEKKDDYELKVKIGNWKDSLNELSGGQRSLVALCLIFSILTYRPAPFYIFDEIDSALDLSYTQSIGEIIKKEFDKSQFIVISLKNGMYENADNVYKVFLKDGKSNICQIK